MSNRIAARFWIQKVTKFAASKGAVQRTVELAPVIRSLPATSPDYDDGKGNVDWAKFTPSGAITLTVTNESAGQAFEDAIGHDVAITFEILD